jgi:fumarate hydratase class I
MTTIRQDDVIQSVADALQYISYYHSPDFIQAMAAAYEREASPAAKDAIKQILVNSRMCAQGHRPICQDTGIVTVFARVGMNVRWDASVSLAEMINEGVRRAYNHPDNKLRASIVADPAFDRKNTRDNTPAVIHMEVVPGDEVEIAVAAKGGGSENKAVMTMLNPSDSIVDWILETVPEMGAGWCPPGMLGIGIGGTAEKAMVLAKESLFEPVDIHEVRARGAEPHRSTAPGNSRQGERARHRRAGTRRADDRAGREDQGLSDARRIAPGRNHSELCGHAARAFRARRLRAGAARSAGPGSLAEAQLRSRARLAPRESGRADAGGRCDVASGRAPAVVRQDAHGPRRCPQAARAADRIGPAAARRPRFQESRHLLRRTGRSNAGEAVGPAGPTTATRMDKFTEMMLGRTGLIAMVGKAERGPEAIAAIRKHKAAYLMAVGGAAYLVSKAIRASRVVAFGDLGMEAIYEFEVKDMPVTVAVDARGESVHETGPAEWRGRIKGIPVKTAVQ